MSQQPYILILYYSQHGNTLNMAEAIANGVESVGDMHTMIRTVPALKFSTETSVTTDMPTQGPPFVTLDDLEQCAGLILGSPTHFGNMAAPLKHFLDQTTSTWLNGKLAGKPAGCFTSTGSLHGGMETTIVSMMLPLLHHGMILAGLPYTEPTLLQTKSGGSPYGPSHLAGPSGDRPLDADETGLCVTFGKRIATLAMQIEGRLSSSS